ncbi:MAG TPA: excinuclease ABC subunit UvrA, partial [Gemmatimonadaceae bacterium]
MAEDALIVRGAREHNLRNIDVTIPRDKLTVVTGLSGSGKSSLAFDTIYAEGQRRYVESLSAYARQFLGLMEKPDVDSIEGLSPAISIEQKTAGHNPRSTVGTVTEIYDYLRLLWARAGTPHCPNCGRPVQRQSAAQIAEIALAWPRDTRIEVRAPLVQGRKGEFRELFETVRKQGFIRAYVDGELAEVATPPKLNRRQNHTISVVVDRLVVRDEDRARLTDSVETALKLAEGVVEISRADTGAVDLFSERYGCPNCGISLPELEPRHFSFNSPFGACPTCGGLGTRRRVSEQLILGDPRISILEGVIIPWGEPSGYLRKIVLPALARQLKFDLNAPWGELPKSVRDTILRGENAGGKREAGSGKRGGSEIEWEGVLRNIERRYDESESDTVRLELQEFMIEVPCDDCGGRRLKREALSVTIDGKSIGDVVEYAVTESLQFFENVPVRQNGKPGLDPEIAGPILKEVRERLRFLVDVGLDYLTLGRAAESLSGGEAQRIRLATQIGSRLVGVLYILDEPSIGLHQRDNARLLATLEQLRDLGNTVIVVEHDEETMRAADHIIDLGPGAGKHGGEVIAAG